MTESGLDREKRTIIPDKHTLNTACESSVSSADDKGTKSGRKEVSVALKKESESEWNITMGNSTECRTTIERRKYGTQMRSSV